MQEPAPKQFLKDHLLYLFVLLVGVVAVITGGTHTILYEEPSWVQIAGTMLVIAGGYICVVDFFEMTGRR